jgi:hypothetical protein
MKVYSQKMKNMSNEQFTLVKTPPFKNENVPDIAHDEIIEIMSNSHQN